MQSHSNQDHLESTRERVGMYLNFWFTVPFVRLSVFARKGIIFISFTLTHQSKEKVNNCANFTNSTLVSGNCRPFTLFPNYAIPLSEMCISMLPSWSSGKTFVLIGWIKSSCGGTNQETPSSPTNGQ